VSIFLIIILILVLGSLSACFIVLYRVWKSNRDAKLREAQRKNYEELVSEMKKTQRR